MSSKFPETLNPPSLLKIPRRWKSCLQYSTIIHSIAKKLRVSGTRVSPKGERAIELCMYPPPSNARTSKGRARQLSESESESETWLRTILHHDNQHAALHASSQLLTSLQFNALIYKAAHPLLHVSSSSYDLYPPPLMHVSSSIQRTNIQRGTSPLPLQGFLVPLARQPPSSPLPLPHPSSSFLPPLLHATEWRKATAEFWIPISKLIVWYQYSPSPPRSPPSTFHPSFLPSSSSSSSSSLIFRPPHQKACATGRPSTLARQGAKSLRRR
jgi:hypothetical protein